MNEKLAKLSPDCSFLLTHLIRKNGSHTDTTPQEKLISILSLENRTPILKAHPVGWYGTTEKAKIFKPYTSNQFISPSQIKGVCFTDSTLAGLKAHRDVFKAFHGLAFDRDFLFHKGANPCLNISNSLLKETANNYKSQSKYKNVYNFIPDQLTGLVNIIHESFDATHEREWRILQDFKFNYADIKFVFCPLDEFEKFSSIQTNGLPVLFDLMWLDRI